MFIDIVKYINIIYKFIMNMSKKMEFKQWKKEICFIF